MSTQASLTVDYYAIISRKPSEAEFNDHTSSSYVYDINGYKECFIKLNKPAAAYLGKKILGAEITMGITPLSSIWTTDAVTTIYSCASAWNNLITAATAPRTYYEKSFDDRADTYGFETPQPHEIGDLIVKLADLGGSLKTKEFIIDSMSGIVQVRPTIIATFSDSAPIFKPSSSYAPKSGPVNRAFPVEFDAAFYWDGKAFSMPTITSYVLRYRAEGAVNYTTVNLPTSGDNMGKATVAGNLLPSGNVEFQFAATDSNGSTQTSAWHVLATEHITIGQTTPAEGTFIRRDQPQTFSAVPLDGCTISKFRYRAKNAGSYTEKTVSGNSITLPANTFGSGDFEYQFVCADRYGVSETSPWTGFNTVDSAVTATPISPIDRIISSNEDNVFIWQHNSPRGTAQTAADLQISSDGSVWTTLATVSGSENRVTVPADTFTSGKHWWRVRTYNLDGVAGAWSQAAVFNAIGNPTAPQIVIEDSGARPVIGWQSSEQAAYELTFDGVLYRGFGSDTADMRWRSPDYVANGAHTVKVRVQNGLGLYSPWAEQSFTVQESSGRIALDVIAGETAELRWNATGYDFYIVYRDDVPIARTTGSEYSDLFSAGSVKYKVRGGYEDNSSYGLSDTVTVSVRPTREILIDAETGETVDLSLTDEQYRSIQISDSLSYGTYQLSGRVKPSVEVGKYRSKTIAFTAAFETPEEEAALLNLLGRVVCCKTRRGRMAIGVLTGIPIEDQEFYSVFTISVTDSDYPEVIDIDTGRTL